MTKPSREEILESWRAMPATGSLVKTIEAFALHWYAAGQADQREKDAGICDKFKVTGLRTIVDAIGDAIRSQAND
jgi:hypothetical protein